MDFERAITAKTGQPWWRSKVARGVAFAVVLAIGLTLRVWRLGEPILWCDEAESCINALTILNHGVPVDHYLGLPIYENTLTDPWPESEEYEFRDSSYSKKGLAIYHGWLPLYSIAGSFKVFGIKPDTDSQALNPVHDQADMTRRTIAGRAPGVIFGMGFLLILFLAGKEMFGTDAGWAAMICAAVSVPMVNIARQARYYSLTAMLSAACCLMAWRMYSRGRYRDFVIAAIAYAAMFHTHILTFAIASAALAVLAPFMLRQRQIFRKFAVFSVIVGSLTIPWLIGTGFLGAAQSVPKAIHTMSLPWDLLAWPQKYWAISALLLGGMAWILLLKLRPSWVAPQASAPFLQASGAFLFLSVWILLGFFMFMLLIPAASLFFQRLYLGAVGPGIIFGAMLFAGAGRAIGGKLATGLACLAFVAFAYGNTQAGYWWQRNKVGQVRLAAMVEEMRGWSLKPGTRVYASPNDHLTLTFYSGMPIQSIAPVRKSFLDSYAGDILFIECSVHVVPIEFQAVRDKASQYGHPMPEEDVFGWVNRINQVATARKLSGLVKRTYPATNPTAPFADAMIQEQLQASPGWARKFNFNYINPAVFRGFDYDDFGKWWQVFFYRFVNPTSRMGDNLNYAERLRRGEARVLPTLWTVYSSPGTGSVEQASQELERK